jgi:hypothetical protein
MSKTYTFTDNTNSFTIRVDGTERSVEYTGGKNFCELQVSDVTENKYLSIRSSSAEFTEIVVNLDTDTILGIGAGSTTATQLRDALLSSGIFFLEDSAAGGLLERVIVNQSNFTTTLGGTIDSTKQYFIDGVIDMGTTQITVPSTGLNLAGYNFDVSGLVSSEDNYTMFVSAVGGSGNVIGKDYKVDVTGANSQVYDLTDATGFNAFEFARINYNGCTSLGEINGYRQGLETGTGRFGGSPSLTLSGSWLGGYRITTSIVRGMSDTTTEPLFKAGTGFSMNSRFLSDANIDLGTLQPFIDFAPSQFPNSGTVQLQEMIITRDGVLDADDPNITPNITSDDLASYWKRNNGLPNTYVGGTTSVVTEVTTTITTADTYVDVEGVFLTTGAEHFTGNADGELTHDGVSPREFTFTGNLTIEGSANREIAVRFVKWDNSTSSFVNLDYTETARPINSFQGGRDVAFIPLSYGGTLDQNDYLKLQVKNITDTNDVSLEIGSYYSIQER